MRPWSNPNLQSRGLIVPGIVALLTFGVTARSVSRERQIDTFGPILVTPLRRVQILIAKALAPPVIGSVGETVIVLWFGVPVIASLVLLYLAKVLLLLRALGVGS